MAIELEQVTLGGKRLGASSAPASAQGLIPTLLVVEDEPLVRSQLHRLFEQCGYDVDAVESAEQALTRLAQGGIDFVVCDTKLAAMSGVELIAAMQESYSDIPVIALTDYLDIEIAVRVLKCGAVDFVVKPFDLTAVRDAVAAALERTRVYMEIRRLRRALKNGAEFGAMLSKTPEMHRLFETIRMVAGTKMAVLIEGENGTGKELAAGAVHYHSARRQGPFVTVNCAGLSDGLLEKELFGCEKGAAAGRAGKIGLADGGTLFLEEVESLSIALQGKLLSVLEERQLERAGEPAASPADVRVITATSAPLKRWVTEGKMRSDFYYRITVVPLRLLALRQRSADMPLLVQDFLHRHPVAVQRHITAVSKQVLRSLVEYSWPGNIPELQNVLERAIVLSPGPIIEKVDLPRTSWEKPPPNLASTTLARWLDEKEKQFIAQKLEDCGGNISVTARSCGIALRSLHRKMQKHGLDKRRFKHAVGDFGDESAMT
jgi:DNA-binding NtrC family response regulator